MNDRRRNQSFARHLLPSLLLAVGLAGCVQPPATAPGNAPQMALAAVTFASLPGWTTDHQSQAMPALLASCARITASAPGQDLGGSGDAARLGGQAGAWSRVCTDAAALPPDDDGATRAVLERDLQAFRVTDPSQPLPNRADALLTGYFEPEVAGSRTHVGAFQTPLYGRPDDLVQADLGIFAADLKGRRISGRVNDGTLVPYYDRAEIENGALARRRLELVWLADPVDAFFLQIQGAGRVRLPDGKIIRLGYAGQNGLPYVAIGKLVAQRSNVPPGEVTMQSIRAWLADHPAEAAAVMQQNPAFVFFRELPNLSDNEGPLGAMGVPLTPGRSAAIDRAWLPLGAPLWVDSTDPIDGSRMQQLLVAQDLGGAITGPLRADIFFGWGPDAALRAGRAHQTGTLTVLLPRAAGS